MSFRYFLDQAAATGDLVTVDKMVDTTFELANVAHALEGRPVLFNQIKGYEDWRVCAGPCSDRKYFSMDLGVPLADLTQHLAQSLENPKLPPIIENGPCQEVVVDDAHASA